MAELILCGQREVSIVDLPARETTWQVRLSQHHDLAENEREWIAWYGGGTDEAKPLDGGRRLLITSVAGAAVIADRATDRLHKIAWLPGLHSAERLPDRRIVLAASAAPDTYPEDMAPAQGHFLVLYDPRRPDEEVWRDGLLSAHGIVWDHGRGLLWALGFERLRSYRLIAGGDAQGGGAFEPVADLPLPDQNGHDLSPMADGNGLYVTTGRHVWTFDYAGGTFTKHPALGDVARVKGIDQDPLTGQLAYIVSDPDSFCSTLVRFTEPEGEPFEREAPVYKARWVK